ncbi:SET and MYND domain-containing protein 4-like [Planococcus citri]|uniref:SET and MYND domain-containing protein 4-like n=1 Tax=Planococcus citri TaxID=170843 RepID=UPI0031F96525
MPLYEEICDSLLKHLDAKHEAVRVSGIFNPLPANEKVSFTYRLMEERRHLPFRRASALKNTQLATEERNLGNKAFCQKKDADALNFYSRSVRLSATKSPELSLAYANRSAVLFKLEKFDLCVLDVDRALGINYPDNLKYKLYERKGKCLMEMGRYSEARQCFQNAREYLSKADINAERLSTLETSLDQSISECEKSDVSDKQMKSVKSFPLPELPSKSPLIPNASAKVRLDSSVEMGRHFVATEDIEPGEILVVEKPYASILLPESYLSHCSNCFIRNLAMIPCEKCSQLMFCNEKCRSESMTRYHMTECDILGDLLALDVSKMESLAVRTLIIATNHGKKLCQLYEDPIFGTPLPPPKASELMNVGDIYDSQSYETVHMLEDNYLKRSPPDLFRKCAVAALLLHVIKYSTFFKNATSKSKTKIPLQKLQDYTGSLLLKYLLAVLSNAHEISEIVPDSSNSASRLGHRSLEIGAALFPLLSLTNHSCDPGAVRHCHYDNCVLRAIQPIAKGQQVFDNYGVHYAVHSLENRRLKLKSQYYFHCVCTACKSDWPLYKDLPSTRPRYLSIDVPFKKLDEYTVELERCFEKISAGKFDEVIDGLCEHLSLLHKYVSRPWKEYGKIQETIKECFACQGNYYDHSDILLCLPEQTED